MSDRDPDDVPLVAAALAGRADAIVPGDKDSHADSALTARLAERDVRPMTPVALLAGLHIT